jgi:hypothetical protein
VDVAVWRCMLVVKLPLGLLDTSCGESWWVAVWAMMAAVKLCRVGGDVCDLFCLLLSRSWAGAQADCKDELRGKEVIEHVKGLLALLAGGVDAGTQGRELRRCNEELADRLAN